MAKPKDSSEDLGKSIADDFDPDASDDSDQDDSGTGDEGAGGGKDESQGGKPEAKKGEEGGKEGEDGKSGKPETVSITKAELEELTTNAVNKAVAAVNSTKDRQIDTIRKEGKDREEELLRQSEEARLAGLSPEDRAKMLASIEIEREGRAAQRKSSDAAEMFRLALIERAITSHAKFGVSREDLEECKSEEELDSVCAQKERDYWRGVAEGTIDPTKDATPKEKRKKPAGSQRKTDVGSGGSGPGPGSDDEPAPTLDGFAKGLVKSGVVPTRGITRVET